MNDKYKKYVSLALVPLTAINVFVGCTVVDSKTVVQDDTISLEEVVENVVCPSEEFVDLVKIYNESELEYDEILLMEDRNSELYASALYAKLKACSIMDEVILDELENIVCFGTQATCVSDEVWVASFGNLLQTISEYDNVIDYYYPLASYVHKRYCDLQHESLFFDENRIICSKIEELLQSKMPSFDYQSYIVDMVNASGNNKFIQQIKNILNSDVDFYDVLNDLENVYQLGGVSRDFSEDIYYSLFGSLMSISSDKDVCVEYYDLSCYIHSLLCDLSQNISEYRDYDDDYSLTLEK